MSNDVRTTDFQRNRVGFLLADLMKKFPPPTSKENSKLFSDSSITRRNYEMFWNFTE